MLWIYAHYPSMEKSFFGKFVGYPYKVTYYDPKHIYTHYEYKYGMPNIVNTRYIQGGNRTIWFKSKEEAMKFEKEKNNE